MRLYLVRHGQTSWNISGRAQGHTDIHLDPTGLDQAARVGEAFMDIAVDRVISSDLSRSAQTAAPISKATGIPLELRSDLRERSFGEWEGLSFTEVTARLQQKAADNGISPQEVRPPGGESFQDVWDRLDPIYNMLCNAEGSIVVVSHGGTLSLLAAKLIRGTLDTSRAFRLANTGITEMELRSEGLFLIVRYSDTQHLGNARVLSGNIDGITR